MSPAAETAGLVLRWAVAPAGAPPLGAAFGLAELLEPSNPLLRDVTGLAACTAARSGLGAEAFGAAPGPGPGAIWLAAAVGLRAQGGLAAEMLRDVPPAATGWAETGWDLVARHGLAAPARPWLPPALAEAVLAASPLTALLQHPARGEEDRALALCRNMLTLRPARQPMVAAFADPEADAVQLDWRAQVLRRLLTGAGPSERSFVLDVYETAVTWHRDAWLSRLRHSTAILQSPAPNEPVMMARALASETSSGFASHGDVAADRATDWALATGRWWQGLRMLRQAAPDALRQRRYLDFQIYWSGLRLAAVTERLYG